MTRAPGISRVIAAALLADALDALRAPLPPRGSEHEEARHRRGQALSWLAHGGGGPLSLAVVTRALGLTPGAVRAELAGLLVEERARRRFKVRCSSCGETFTAASEGAKRCRHCRRVARRAGFQVKPRPPAEPAARICQSCGQTFTSAHGRAAACSPGCAHAARLARQRERRAQA